MDQLTAGAFTGGFRALPPEVPLAMPVQALGVRPERRGQPASSPAGMGWRRLGVFGPAVALTGLGAWQMSRVLGVNGLTPLEIGILVVFTVLFAWIGLSLVSSVFGFVSVLRHGGRGSGSTCSC